MIATGWFALTDLDNRLAAAPRKPRTWLTAPDERFRAVSVTRTQDREFLVTMQQPLDTQSPRSVGFYEPNGSSSIVRVGTSPSPRTPKAEALSAALE